MNAMTEFSTTWAPPMPCCWGHHRRHDVLRHGGLVNKAAYAFGVGLLASKTHAPMAAVMAAGMVPALGWASPPSWPARSSSRRSRKRAKASLRAGSVLHLRGPFPLPPGSHAGHPGLHGGRRSLTGALSMLFGCELVAPTALSVRALHPERHQQRHDVHPGDRGWLAVDWCLLRHAQARRGAGQAGDRLSRMSVNEKAACGPPSYGWQKGGKRQRSRPAAGGFGGSPSLALRRAASTLVLARPRHRRITSCCWARVMASQLKRSRGCAGTLAISLVVQLADPMQGSGAGRFRAVPSMPSHTLSPCYNPEDPALEKSVVQGVMAFAFPGNFGIFPPCKTLGVI